MTRVDWKKTAAHAEEEAERLRNELKRIENIANCGSVDSWMTLSDEQKREWFAVTLHVDSEQAKIIREFHDAWPGRLDEIESAIEFRDNEIERLREEVQRPSARLIEDRHAAEIAHENAVSAEPVACPYPCGWRELHRIIVESGAYLACGLVEDEPVTGRQREETMRMIGYARDLCLMGMKLSQPSADAKDAARYRWLRDYAEPADWELIAYHTKPETTDDAIDAMRKGNGNASK